MTRTPAASANIHTQSVPDVVAQRVDGETLAEFRRRDLRAERGDQILVRDRESERPLDAEAQVQEIDALGPQIRDDPSGAGYLVRSDREHLDQDVADLLEHVLAIQYDAHGILASSGTGRGGAVKSFEPASRPPSTGITAPVT